MERRGYPRTNVSNPIEFYVQPLQGPSDPWIGRGTLDNLSLTGIFFAPEDYPPMKKGDIGDFTFTLSHPVEGFSQPFIIKARGEVKRVEPPQEQSPWGVAVHFLTGPYFA